MSNVRVLLPFLTILGLCFTSSPVLGDCDAANSAIKCDVVVFDPSARQTVGLNHYSRTFEAETPDECAKEAFAAYDSFTFLPDPGLPKGGACFFYQRGGGGKDPTRESPWLCTKDGLAKRTVRMRQLDAVEADNDSDCAAKCREQEPSLCMFYEYEFSSGSCTLYGLHPEEENGGELHECYECDVNQHCDKDNFHAVPRILE